MQWRISAGAHRRRMCRRQRQFNELRDLCCTGGVVRAIDLAFEHFAHYGRDEQIIDLLGRAIEDAGEARRARERFAELCMQCD